MTRTLPSTDHAATDLSRRALLGRLVLAGAGGVIATALTARPLLAAMGDDGLSTALHTNGMRTPIDTPADALRALAQGNRRFVEGRAIGPHRTLARVKDVAAKQEPFAAVLSCADSRAPVEILFDQGIGDVFVCRAAGNVVTPEMIGSLEFGTLVLGAKVLVVLGHSDCGAVKATIAGEAVPGQISTLYQHIQPAVDRVSTQSSQGKPELEAVVHENVRMQVRLLGRSSPVLGGLVKEGKLTIVGGMYDLATGHVAMLG